VNSNKNSNSIVNHSIASQSVSKQQQLIQKLKQNANFQLNHVACESFERGIKNTGINKRVDLNDVTSTGAELVKNGHLNRIRDKDNKNDENNDEDDHFEGNNDEDDHFEGNNDEDDGIDVIKYRRKSKAKSEKFSLKKSMRRARTMRSQNNDQMKVFVEQISNVPRIASQQQQLVQLKTTNVINKQLLENYRQTADDCSSSSEGCKKLSRDERLSMRKMYLRHAVNQYEGIHRLQRDSLERSKLHFRKTNKILKAFNRTKNEM
jgi:hypothetical protein